MVIPRDLVALVAVVVVALAVSKLTDSEAKRRSLPQGVRTVVEFLALGGVWLAYFSGAVPSIVVDDTVVAFTVSIGLLVVLPVVLAPFVETTPAADAAC